MRIIAQIVQGWRRIGMGALRLSTWGVQERTCFTKRESWGRLGLFLVVGKHKIVRIGWTMYNSIVIPMWATTSHDHEEELTGSMVIMWKGL